MNPNSNQYARYPLGTTELKFSPIGLGTWQFSQGKGMIGKFWPTLSNTSIHDIVHTALDSGINWFDTAQAYGGGQQGNVKVVMQAVAIFGSRALARNPNEVS